MRRAYVPRGLPLGDPESFPVDADVAHYVGRVLRVERGATILLFDADGRRCVAQVEWRGSEAWAVGARWQAAAESAEVEIELWASLMRPQRWDWLLEKATELGAARLLALHTDRSVVRIPGPRQEERRLRWRRQVGEAARQCRRDRPPAVDGPLSLAEAISEGADALIVLDEALGAERTLSRVVSALPPLPAGARVALISGPEGGFADEERAALVAAGALRAGLGPRILRAETAPLAALVLAQHLLTGEP